MSNNFESPCRFLYAGFYSICLILAFLENEESAVFEEKDHLFYLLVQQVRSHLSDWLQQGLKLYVEACPLQLYQSIKQQKY